MSLFAFWTLFAFGAVVLATVAAAARTRFAPVLICGAFACGLLLFAGGWRLQEWAGAALVALLAGVQLLPSASAPGSRQPWLALAAAAVAAGFIAAEAAAFLIERGVPGLIASAATAVPVLLAFGLAVATPSFAPRRLLDEALLLLLAAGLCLAAAPEVISGWRSATSLNASVRGEAIVIPVWVLVAIGAAALAGALSRWWRRD